MADTKDTTHTEYENIIEELMNENEILKKKVLELKGEIAQLKYRQNPVEEKQIPTVQKDTKKQVKLFKKGKKKGKSEVPGSLVEKKTDKPKEPQEAVTLKLMKNESVEGISRRECPICGNNRKSLIHEEIDKTKIILDYPRVYGKRYKCGQCGTFWYLPIDM
jgi:hypothetical protein